MIANPGRLAAAATVALALTAVPASAEITRRDAREWRPDTAAARDYANSRAGSVSFAVADLNRRLHRHRGAERVPMMSTFKVMLMVAYLRQERVENRMLTREEKALLRPMIRRSDNESASELRDRLGRHPVERLADRARMKGFRWDPSWPYCRTSARDQAVFMRNLRRHIPRRHEDFAMRQFARIVRWQRWGIAQLDLHGWVLRFKSGWNARAGGFEHQVAQLESDGRRLGIAVLTQDNPSHAYGMQTLKGVFARLLRGLPR